jgi:hypothetical protein
MLFAITCILKPNEKKDQQYKATFKERNPRQTKHREKIFQIRFPIKTRNTTEINKVKATFTGRSSRHSTATTAWQQKA